MTLEHSKSGYKQVQTLLCDPTIRADRMLTKIFRIIEQDKPIHWAPYDDWMRTHEQRKPSWAERAIDAFIHAELLLVKLPILFMTPRLARRETWPDELDQTPAFLDKPERFAQAF